MSYRKKILDYLVEQVETLIETNEKELYGLAQRKYGLTRKTYREMLKELHYAERIRYIRDLEQVFSLLTKDGLQIEPKS